MAYAKNKKSNSHSSNSHVSTSAKNLHTSKTRAQKSYKAQSRSYIFKFSKRARQAVLTIIILAALTVIATVFFATISTPENLVKSKIEAIATDYYENYFYDLATKDAPTEPRVEEILSRYESTGFSRVSLEQLLLFDAKRHAAETSVLADYCDLDSTFITIYPDAPFSRKDYHVDYHYSCIF